MLGTPSDWSVLTGLVNTRAFSDADEKCDIAKVRGTRQYKNTNRRSYHPHLTLIGICWQLKTTSQGSCYGLFWTSGVLSLSLAALLSSFSLAVFALRRNYKLYAWKRLSVSSPHFEITQTGGRGELVNPAVTMIVAIVTSQRTNRGNAQNSQKWRRRLSQIQLFEADFSNHSSFKWYCLWISRRNYHCTSLRGK